MRRRELLAAAMVTGGLAALVACQVPAVQVLGDLQTLDLAFQNALPQLATVVGLTPPQVQRVGGYIYDIDQAVASVAQNSAAAPTAVPQVYLDLQRILAVLAALPPGALPPPWPAALGAAQVLLPALATVLGITLPAAAETGAVAGLKSVLPWMTLAQARETLALQALQRAPR